MKTIYIEDRPWLPGAVWTIKRYVRKRSTWAEEGDTAEHGADFILKLTKDDREWEQPLYTLTDGAIEDTMNNILSMREHTLRAETIDEAGEVLVE